VQPIGVEVPQAGRRVEAARADLVVAQPRCLELEVAQARGGGETERTQLLPVVERPDVALLGVQDLRRASAKSARDTLLPEFGRLVHVRVGIDDGVVDAGYLYERVGHQVLPVNIGAITSPATPG